MAHWNFVQRIGGVANRCRFGRFGDVEWAQRICRVAHRRLGSCSRQTRLSNTSGESPDALVQGGREAGMRGGLRGCVRGEERDVTVEGGGDVYDGVK